MATHDAAAAVPAPFASAWVTDGENDSSARAPSTLPERHSSGRRARKGSKVDYARLAGEYFDDSAAPSSPASGDGDAAADDNFYANRHVVRFLRDTFDDADNVLQIVEDGSELTAAALRRNGGGTSDGELSIHRPILIRDTAESIGMNVPRGKGKQSTKPEPNSGDGTDNSGEGDGGGVTIREIGELVGMHHEVTVMDVRTQDELDGWTFADLVDYFEDDSRVYTRRTARAAASSKPPPRVLNQISLEFSHTPLRDLVSSPQFVRDLDWIDTCWPSELRAAGDYPRVQYYCLTSTEGCYTDFHVDFGGTSVWYHVLSGRKVFLLIPPTPTNMKLYEGWLCRRDQNDHFFPDLTSQNAADGSTNTVEGTVRISVEPHQTVIIPTGWIHAVYTPLDSIVLGGNFLHGLDAPGQLDVHCLETRTRVPAKFRFPNFVRMMFYAGASYLQKLRSGIEGAVCPRELDGLPRLCDALRSWAVKPSGDVKKVTSPAHAAADCARRTGCANAAEMVKKLEAAAAAAAAKAKNSSQGGPKIKLKLSLKGTTGGTAGSGSQPTPRLRTSAPSSSSSAPQPSPRLRIPAPSAAASSSAAAVGKQQQRPKLKLRLGGAHESGPNSPVAPSPRAPSRGSTAASAPPPSAAKKADVENDDGGGDDGFRITIGAASSQPGATAQQRLPAMAPAAKRQRTSSGRVNDLSSAYGAVKGPDDDEWVPGGGGRKRRRSGGSKKKKPLASSPPPGAVPREAVLGAFRAEFGDDVIDGSDDSDAEEGGGRAARATAPPKKTRVKLAAAAKAKTKVKAAPVQQKAAAAPAPAKRQSLSSRQRLQKRFKF